MIYKNIFAPGGKPFPKSVTANFPGWPVGYQDMIVDFPGFEDGDIVDGGNFSRPYTDKPELIDGGKKVAFKNCNLTNCATTIPPVDCNTYQGPIPVNEPPTEEEKDAAFQAAAEQLVAETYGEGTPKTISMKQAIANIFKPAVAPEAVEL